MQENSQILFRSASINSLAKPTIVTQPYKTNSPSPLLLAKPNARLEMLGTGFMIYCRIIRPGHLLSRALFPVPELLPNLLVSSSTVLASNLIILKKDLFPIPMLARTSSRTLRYAKASHGVVSKRDNVWRGCSGFHDTTVFDGIWSSEVVCSWRGSTLAGTVRNICSALKEDSGRAKVLRASVMGRPNVAFERLWGREMMIRWNDTYLLMRGGVCYGELLINSSHSRGYLAGHQLSWRICDTQTRSENHSLTLSVVGRTWLATSWAERYWKRGNWIDIDQSRLGSFPISATDQSAQPRLPLLRCTSLSMEPEACFQLDWDRQ